MAERFRWGDEGIPKQTVNLERQVATEKDYDECMTNKINSAKGFEKLRLLTDVAERDNLISQGIHLGYYRNGDKVYWSAQIQTLKK
jgi:hypothetical protein